MRTVFHEQLARLVDQLVSMTELVADMMAEATASLLSGDLERAEATMTADGEVNLAQQAADEQIIDLMTRQAPVATDMRSLVAALRITTDLERMGDLAAHIAKVARRRYPDTAVPADLVETFASLGTKNQSIAEKAGLMLATSDLELCDEVVHDDKEINDLHRSMFATLLRHDWPGTTEQAVDLALLGRYYERFGDHCVLIAGHVRYLVTGSYERTVASPQR